MLYHRHSFPYILCSVSCNSFIFPSFDNRDVPHIIFLYIMSDFKIVFLEILNHYIKFYYKSLDFYKDPYYVRRKYFLGK